MDDLAMTHVVQKFTKEKLPILLPVIFGIPGVTMTINWEETLHATPAQILETLTEHYLKCVIYGYINKDVLQCETPISQAFLKRARKEDFKEFAQQWAASKAAETWEQYNQA